MPNPPKPTEENRRLGNPGKRALPAIQNVIALPMAMEPPEPPRPLGVEGSKLWKRIWEQGRTWISSKSDLEMVTLLCVALRSLDAQLQTLLSLLGMSPTDRTKLGVAEVQARSKIQDLLQKHDAAKEK